MSNERIHVANILLSLTDGLYNIKIDDRNELAYLRNGLLYTLDICNISYSERKTCSKLDIDMKCKGNVVPLWKCMNITSIKHINSDDELLTNESKHKRGDSMIYNYVMDCWEEGEQQMKYTTCEDCKYNDCPLKQCNDCPLKYCIDFGCTLYVHDSCPHKEKILNPYTINRCSDICNYYNKYSYCVNYGKRYEFCITKYNMEVDLE